MERRAAQIEFNKHDYGLVLRSSAIFYFKKNNNFKTTISFLNYWKIKRNLDVTIITSLRKMNGSLVKREVLDFKRGIVINYCPEVADQNFEGSVEIEVFSLQDMVIPYAGIIVVYESKSGVSMVHSYGRTYSNHEIEEGRMITAGEECCIPIRDSEEIESFTIIHNGNQRCQKQEAIISVLNHKGKRREYIFSIHDLAPYETVKIRHKDHFPGLIPFLENETGYASISFNLRDSFTRMLACNQKLDGTDFQVCHSDFNYSKHITDKLPDGKFAVMRVPRLADTVEEAVVYPDCDPGNYEVFCEDGKSVPFNDDKAAILPLLGSESEEFVFKKINGKVPTRIHTGIRLSKSKSLLPAESCLGVYHESVPPKRFHWGICTTTRLLKSRIILQQYSTTDMKADPKMPVTIRIYSSTSQDYRETSIKSEELSNGKFLTDLFPDAEKFLENEFGWFTLFSSYPRCNVYSTIENNEGSITFEHTI